MGASFPSARPITTVAPIIRYYAETAIRTEKEGRLGMAASAVRGLYYFLFMLRERDAFFHEEWQKAHGPELLAVPHDELVRFPPGLQCIRGARLALFALMERQAHPFRPGRKWPLDPNEEQGDSQ